MVIWCYPPIRNTFTSHRVRRGRSLLSIRRPMLPDAFLFPKMHEVLVQFKLRQTEKRYILELFEARKKPLRIRQQMPQGQSTRSNKPTAVHCWLFTTW